MKTSQGRPVISDPGTDSASFAELRGRKRQFLSLMLPKKHPCSQVLGHPPLCGPQAICYIKQNSGHTRAPAESRPGSRQRPGQWFCRCCSSASPEQSTPVRVLPDPMPSMAKPLLGLQPEENEHTGTLGSYTKRWQRRGAHYCVTTSKVAPKQGRSFSCRRAGSTRGLRIPHALSSHGLPAAEGLHSCRLLVWLSHPQLPERAP